MTPTIITPLLILLFIAITFLQSGYDKITDWKGNVTWLKTHFKDTILQKQVPLALFTILLLEVIAGILALAGMYSLLVSNTKTLGFYAAVLSCITLLFLLLGQRLAKDYDGARTIVIYFIPAIMGVYLLA